MTDTNKMLFQFNPQDPKFLMEGIWKADVILPSVQRSFVLIRVSTKKEEQNSSIAHQLEHAKHYALRTGSQVVRIYVIRNSGLSMKRNKTFQKMQAAISRGECDLLYLHSLSRLSRNSARLEGFVAEFIQHKTRVYAMIEGFDTTHKGWRTAILNWGFVYNHESLAASDRQRGCVKALELRGQYLGAQAPYGYEKDLNKGLRSATDGSAEVVREIFAMALAGTSPCQIARILTDRGIPSPAIKLGRDTSGKWGDNSIRKILRNPIYRGDIRGRCTEVIEPGELARQVIPEEERVIHRGAVEGIVESDVFDAVQKILSERARGKKGAVTDFTEAGMDFMADKLFCADCGHPMTQVSRDWGQTHYVCSTHVRKGKTCKGRHSVVKSALEQAIKLEVIDMLTTNDALAQIHEQLRLRQEKKRSTALKTIRILERKIEILQRREVQIMADFYDSGLASAFEEEDLRSNLQALLASTKAEIQEKQNKKQKLEQSLFVPREEINRDYKEIVTDRIEELVRLLVQRIEIDVHGNVARIVYNCVASSPQNITVA